MNVGNITEEEYHKLSPSIEIKNKTILLKHCHTCKIIREPRSFHCGLCGNCIKRHDHHCGFVANCIGKYNTHKFCFFLFSICLHALVVFITASIKLVNVTFKLESMDYWTPADYMNITLSIISGLFFVVLFSLLFYHIYLISKNKTTNEHLRNSYEDKLFDQGCNKNWEEVFSPNKNENNEN